MNHRMGLQVLLCVGVLGVTALAVTAPSHAACCYFSAKDRDVDQPGQKAFITWEPASKQETFTVQPRFEGNASDFGMVIPTPGQPKLDEMPRDFFKHLALYTILLPFPQPIRNPLEPEPWSLGFSARSMRMAPKAMPTQAMARGDHGVRVLEAGVVGSLDYKILTAENANGLYDWLKENKYSYAGDQAALDFYVQKKWIFTVMKIDTKQMKRRPDGSFLGEVTPTRFSFASDALVYPLKITQISVKRNTEALFYVQSPQQMDFQGYLSWLWSYRIMWLMSGTVCLSQKQMTDEERAELSDRQTKLHRVRQEIPNYDTTKLEWARRLKPADLALLDAPLKEYAQAGLTDLPEGARPATLEEMKTAFLAARGTFDKLKNGLGMGDPQARLAHLDRTFPPDKGVIVEFKDPQKGGTRFFWFPNREAPDKDVEALSQLRGFLKEGQFLTKIRKVFLKHEMKEDLELHPVEPGKETEYFRILPQSPP